MMNSFKPLQYLPTIFIALMLSFYASGSAAVGGNYSSSANLEPVLEMIENGQFDAAIDFLHTELDYDPDNADILTLLGFSYRKSRNFEDAMTYYEWAIKSEPEHRGANEYLGELYLETNQIDKAVEQLNKLESLCSVGCREYGVLKDAIDNFQKTAGAS
ncbi:MAG: tetratricopeptide (TPR) repeat protein [Planctomycetota bacterium]|jgi:tetratricopeptide (TPR) repeat protein